MKFTRTRAIIACSFFVGVISAPAFGQSHGLIARGNCPKAARTAYAPGHSPAPSYKPVSELERYIASLQAAPPDSRERSRTKRSRFASRPD